MENPTMEVLKLWTEKRKLLGYAQKQIEARKQHDVRYIQRRLKPLPSLPKLLKTNYLTEKRNRPVKAIEKKVALRPKEAPKSLQNLAEKPVLLTLSK